MKQEFSKRVVLFVLINSMIWIYLSYLLAWIGKEQIAETLSSTVVNQVIGVCGVYFVKACLENLSKNNKWPDKHKEEGETDEPGGQEQTM